MRKARPINFNSIAPWRCALLGLALFSLGLTTALLAHLANPVRVSGAVGGAEWSAEPGFRNTEPGVAYVGSEACGKCHTEIFEEYRRSEMGRSMSPGGQPMEPGGRLAAPVTIFEKELNRHFQVFRKGGALYQSIFEVDENGREVARHTEKIDFTIGTGVNGYGYIVQRGDFLFQAPIVFYAETQSWGLAPGYESYDFGFSRPITVACLACHSGRPQPVPDRQGKYKSPPLKELAIGCESCHGPGRVHVQERLQGKPDSGDVDRTIVNPAKVPGWLADNICMSCHQEGDARVLKPGKAILDFRPGTPLDDTVAIFKIPANRQPGAALPLLDYYSQMVLSRCYQDSAGRLGCLTCHRVHSPSALGQEVNPFKEKCLSCHEDMKRCSFPVPARLRESARDDCAGCHMPKRGVQRIPHAAVTRHRIAARTGQPYPEYPIHQKTSAAPDLIHVNAIPGEQDPALPPVVLLQAYRQILLKNSDPVYARHYSDVLTGLAGTEQGNPLVLAALAQESLGKGTDEEKAKAILYLNKAIALGSKEPADYLLLADLLTQSRRVLEAISVLQTGILVNPYNILFHRSLAVRYMSVGEFKEAVKVIKNGLDLDPINRELRNLLGKAERGM